MGVIGDCLWAVRSTPKAAVAVLCGQAAVVVTVYGAIQALPYVGLLVGLTPLELAAGSRIGSLGAILFVCVYFSLVALAGMIVWTPFKGVAVHAVGTGLRGTDEGTTSAILGRWQPLAKWAVVAALSSTVVGRLLPWIPRIVLEALHESDDDSSWAEVASFVMPALVLGDADTVEVAVEEAQRRAQHADGIRGVVIVMLPLTFLAMMLVWTATLSVGVSSPSLDRWGPTVLWSAVGSIVGTFLLGLTATFLTRTAIRTRQYVEADPPSATDPTEPPTDPVWGIE